MLPLQTLPRINPEESRKVFGHTKFEKIKNINFEQQPRTSFASFGREGMSSISIIKKVKQFISSTEVCPKLHHHFNYEDLHHATSSNALNLESKLNVKLPCTDSVSHFSQLDERCRKIALVEPTVPELFIYYPISLLILEMVHDMRLKAWWIIRRKPYREFNIKSNIIRTFNSSEQPAIHNEANHNLVNEIVLSILVRNSNDTSIQYHGNQYEEELQCSDLKFQKYESIQCTTLNISKQALFNDVKDFSLINFSNYHRVSYSFVQENYVQWEAVNFGFYEILSDVLCAKPNIKSALSESMMDILDDLPENQTNSKNSTNYVMEIHSKNIKNFQLIKCNKDENDPVELFLPKCYQFNCQSLVKTVKLQFDTSKDLIATNQIESKYIGHRISFHCISNSLSISKLICSASNKFLTNLKLKSLIINQLLDFDNFGTFNKAFNHDRTFGTIKKLNLNEIWPLVFTIPIKVVIATKTPMLEEKPKDLIQKYDSPNVIYRHHSTDNKSILHKRSVSEAQLTSNTYNDDVFGMVSKVPKVLESKILISGSFFEHFPEIICDFKKNYLISCIDVPIQDEVDMIIDPFQAVYILESIDFQPEAFKEKVRKMIQSSFKFIKIWIVVLAPDAKSANQFKMQITKSITKFPCTVILRDAEEGNLSQLCHVVAEMITRNETKFQFSSRAFLDLLVDSSFLAQADFLQRFPSINLYIASILLSAWKMHEITSVGKEELLTLLSKLCQSEHNKILLDYVESLKLLLMRMK